MKSTIQLYEDTACGRRSPWVLCIRRRARHARVMLGSAACRTCQPRCFPLRQRDWASVVTCCAVISYDLLCGWLLDWDLQVGLWGSGGTCIHMFKYGLHLNGYRIFPRSSFFGHTGSKQTFWRSDRPFFKMQACQDCTFVGARPLHVQSARSGQGANLVWARAWIQHSGFPDNLANPSPRSILPGLLLQRK